MFTIRIISFMLIPNIFQYCENYENHSISYISTICATPQLSNQSFSKQTDGPIRKKRSTALILNTICGNPKIISGRNVNNKSDEFSLSPRSVYGEADILNVKTKPRDFVLHVCFVGVRRLKTLI